MSKKEINIHINGESKKIKAEKTIEMLLKELNLNKNNIAIEINREIINQNMKTSNGRYLKFFYTFYNLTIMMFE